MSEKFRREALGNIPTGYYALPIGEKLRATDLVWSWTCERFLRADSPLWLFDTLTIPPEEIICAVRRPELFGFDGASRRTFTLRK